jgi:dTDP-4-amino-4,6-dideoxygalactose transaminase
MGGDHSLSAVYKGGTGEYFSDRFARATFFESGRDAIRAVLSQFSNRKVIASAYSCKAVLDAFSHTHEGALVFVDIDESYYPNTTQLVQLLQSYHGDYSRIVFFLGNLWGIPYPKSLLELLNIVRSGGGVIVEDLTHNLDASPLAQAHFWIASLRKWLGTSGLAAAAPSIGTTNALPVPTVHASQVSLRLFQLRTLSHFKHQSAMRIRIIESLRRSDAALGNRAEPVLAHAREIQRFRSQDWPKIFARRMQNKSVLEQILRHETELQILNKVSSDCGPFATTIELASGSAGLKNYLRQHDIYAATLWPLGNWAEVHPRSLALSNSCLTLPCDERYSPERVEEMAHLVLRFLDSR